jgi:hypothetical protein
MNASQIYELEKSSRLLEHHEQINAILIAIKPGLFENCLINYSKVKIKEYIKSIRNE